MTDRKHFRIQVNGIVQGVGFRPFIYSLATRCNLEGTVLNSQDGVIIHIAGEHGVIDKFVDAISSDAPPAAEVKSIAQSELPDRSYAGFSILRSDADSEGFTQIPADLALCEACRRELHDSDDRRFEYPLINCTNCGPRFTIIQDLPYDRPMTTMSEFAMCNECRSEYENPLDRRFHAQPVACHTCGPAFRFLKSNDSEWKEVEGDAIEGVAGELKRGNIALIQGIGGFHLACDALNDDAVKRLRERKQRERKPLAVMFPSLEMLSEYCEVSDTERKILHSPKAPIVLVKKLGKRSIAESVAPGNPYLGVMLAYSPLHELLLRELNRPLVMTSANLSDDPIAYLQNDALERMRGIADTAILHERKIHIFADDSIVKVFNNTARVWRRARGYVPEPLYVSRRFKKQVLAFGPQMKNTFCFGRDNVALLSQHLGDLDSEAAISAQQAALDHFLKLYEMRVDQVVSDLHPDYTSTRLAQEWASEHDLPLIEVQHHHAHFAACLAENHWTEQAIGLILDGTGYGTDSTVWGGEVLVGDASEVQRYANLMNVPMPGGEKAAKEPWRMAVSWLFRTFGDSWISLDIPFVSRLLQAKGEQDLKILLDPHLMTSIYPRTSSMGRLFDAVSAIVNFGVKDQFEGQAAMELEWLAQPGEFSSYPIEIEHQSNERLLNPTLLFKSIVKDIVQNEKPSIISARFHNALSDVLLRCCLMNREETGISTVALSGGCFQNSVLLTGLTQQLEECDFKVLTHSRIPCNDGGVSFGQVIIANEQTGE